MAQTREQLTEGSTIVTGIRTVRKRLDRALAEARVVESVRSLRSGSSVVGERDREHAGGETSGGGDAAAIGESEAEETDESETGAIGGDEDEAIGGTAAEAIGGTAEEAIADDDGAIDDREETASVTSSGADADQSDPLVQPQAEGQSSVVRSSMVRSRFTEQSAAYGLFRAGASFVRSSYLYQWLTAEPEPEVIVIDLRETWIIGPLIDQLDAAISIVEREGETTTATSAALRVGYRVRNAFVDRPLRVLSFGVIGLVIVAFVSIALGGGELGPVTFVLFAALLLAVAGTRSTRSWAAVTQSRGYELLVAAFEPPEPPERVSGPDSPDQRGDEETSVERSERGSVNEESIDAGDDSTVGEQVEGGDATDSVDETTAATDTVDETAVDR